MIKHEFVSNSQENTIFRKAKFRKEIFIMQQININELKPHPRNNEFFDDIVGEKWDELLDSIRKRIKDGKRGNIEPIIITQDKIIVSGHQRVRAFKELSIPTIEAEIRIYNSDDEVLLDLLESNIRRRGEIGGSAKKVGKRIKELERLYGIHQGNGSNQYEQKPNSSVIAKSQSDLAAQMGISVDTLQNYKLLAEMIPELSDLVDTGIVTKTTALAIMKELSEEDQENLIASMDTTKRITQKEVKQYIDEINYLKDNPTVKEIVQEPDDYKYTKKQLQYYKQDYSTLKSDFDEKVKELQDLRKQLENIKNVEESDPYSEKIKNSTLLFCSKIATFIEQVGGYVWLTDEINKIPELEREGYIKSVHAIKSWADTMEFNINNKTKEIN
nr:MAG TPA: chromosome partitioning protein [Caudoviricetes sp.]